MSGCSSGGCGSCGGCGSQDSGQPTQNIHSSVKRVIGIASGKGGVGKSLVTSLLACAISRRGLSVAILDADVTGPSIPHIFGLHTMAACSDKGLHPVDTDGGIRVMSVNLLLENESQPVVWRGPVASGVVTQFWADVVWGNVDCMLVDLPPGTGDVPLTVMQSLPLDCVLLVTSPQDITGTIVDKALNMAKSMNVPVAGMVENYSYYICPDCGGRHNIFGTGRDGGDTPVLDRLPIDPRLAVACDSGTLEGIDWGYLQNTLTFLGY